MYGDLINGVKKYMKNIKLIDINNYLRVNLRLIIYSAFLGFTISLIYCSITPKLYEASFTLRLARIDSRLPHSHLSEKLGKEIPFILDAQRAFGNPSYPNSRLLNLCGFDQSNMSIKKLIAETTVMRGPDNKELFVRIKVPGRKNVASCAHAIVEDSINAYNARKGQIIAELLEEIPGAKIQDFVILDPSLNGVISVSDSYVYPNFFRIISGSVIFSILGCLYINWLRKKIASIIKTQE